MRGSVREEGMQGIETDDTRAKAIRHFDDPIEIGEVPDAPIPRRTHAIKLKRQTPNAFITLKCGRLIAALGRNDEGHAGSGSMALDLDAVVAGNQPR